MPSSTRLVSGLDAFPRYYAYIAPRNREGAGTADHQLPAASAIAELAARARAGEWVIDLRERHAFAARHLVATLGFELSDPFTTYLGWLLPWGSPLSLIGSAADLASARRALARIGIEKIAACHVIDAASAATRGPESRPRRIRWSASLRSSRTSPIPGRWSSTYASGANGMKATSRRPCTFPCTSCPIASTRFPQARVWVHCAAGYRAAVAGSLLARAGRDVMVVSDQFSSAVDAGLEIVSDCD